LNKPEIVSNDSTTLKYPQDIYSIYPEPA